MRRLFVVVLAVLAISVSLSAQAFASQQGVVVIQQIANDYYGITPTVRDLGKNNYEVTGPGGTDVIQFVPATINALQAGRSIESACSRQARQLRAVMTAPVKPVTQVPAKPCDGCVEREGVWKRIPPIGTKTATIKNGYYGNFEVVYDVAKKCPAVQQWRKSPGDSASERKKLWFKDKAMADQWLANSLTPDQLEQKLAGVSFKAASIGYQKWVDLAL